jgi:hypothetical protein
MIVQIRFPFVACENDILSWLIILSVLIFKDTIIHRNIHAALLNVPRHPYNFNDRRLEIFCEHLMR